MGKDFYLDERGLAGYFEKDWFDHIVNESGKSPFAFAPFAVDALYDGYHEQMASRIAQSAARIGLRPESLLEIGSSLGRMFYESCVQIPSLKSATLIEPSQNLHGGFERIFHAEEIARFSVLKGNGGTSEVKMNTQSVKAACAHINFQCLNVSFQAAPLRDLYNLVICSNVIDQTRDHVRLVEDLKNSVSVGGILAISCTYQWQDKYIGVDEPQPEDLKDLFTEADWALLDETNLPFQLRINERHWMRFLSHVLILQRK